MKLLEDRILKDGKIYAGDVLKVDSFINHQIDADFLSLLGKEFYRLFEKSGVTKILTIEASGIGIACLTAVNFHCPVVYAKKSKSSNMANDLWMARAHSYTHGTDHDIVVSKQYLSANDRILVLDDFLASGSAAEALVEICNQAGAEIVGIGMVIEKAYQNGGNILRQKGYHVESLAKIASMNPEDGITFC